MLLVLIDVTVADEDTNSIPSDGENRVIFGKWGERTPFYDFCSQISLSNYSWRTCKKY